jgi:hypothetical protein
LSEAVVEWTRLFDSDKRPMVETRDTGTEIVFRDTRPVASEGLLTLSGLERDVYTACENGRRAEHLCNELHKKGVAISETETIIDRLIAKHLLLSLEDHLLALGIPKPLSDIPRYPHLPFGSIDRVLYAALLSARGITDSL